MSRHQPVAANPVAEFDQQPTIALIETDRFCDGCGYNLRTQQVRRDPRTDLLLCRCPECGRFHPAREGTTAGHVWLRRLGTVLLFVWIVLLLSVGLGLGSAQLGINIATLEELTTYRHANITTTVTPQGIVTITSSSGPTPWRREVDPQFEHYAEFIALMAGLSLALGFLLILVAVTAMHHWRRWGYYVLALAMPFAAGALAWKIWAMDNPHLAEWATMYVLGFSAAYLIGALLGIPLGRPLARLLATLLLPPRVRPVLSFLWLADGKEPPRGSHAARA